MKNKITNWKNNRVLSWNLTEFRKKNCNNDIICVAIGEVMIRKNIMANAFVVTEMSGNKIAAHNRSKPTPIVAALTVTDNLK